MNNLANQIAEKIANELKLDAEKRDVIAYGLFGFLHILSALLLVALFGYLLGILIQALIVSFASNILRQYSGGVHASKPIICLIIGTIITVGIALTVTHMAYLLNDVSSLLIEFIFFVCASLIVYKKAPIDSEAKPIKTETKRKRMRKNSFIIISIYLLVVLVLSIIYFKTNNVTYLGFSGCIIGALSWQAFTLTIIGHKVLNEIDSILSRLLFRERSV